MMEANSLIPTPEETMEYLKKIPSYLVVYPNSSDMKELGEIVTGSEFKQDSLLTTINEQR